jgi:hypothetical protein
MFSTDEWVNGLSWMASNLGREPNVIGMSLRNEPRTIDRIGELHHFMELGAKAVNAANPDLLIIVAGIGYAGDLSKERGNRLPDKLDSLLQDKFVYEAHQYSWYGTGIDNSRPEASCLSYRRSLQDRFLFLMLEENGRRPFPLIYSEWVRTST